MFCAVGARLIEEPSRQWWDSPEAWCLPGHGRCAKLLLFGGEEGDQTEPATSAGVCRQSAEPHDTFKACSASVKHSRLADPFFPRGHNIISTHTDNIELPNAPRRSHKSVTKLAGSSFPPVVVARRGRLGGGAALETALRKMPAHEEKRLRLLSELQQLENQTRREIAEAARSGAELRCQHPPYPRRLSMRAKPKYLMFYFGGLGGPGAW